MSDVTQATVTSQEQPTAPTGEQPLGNQTETRNPDGSIKDQQAPPQQLTQQPEKSGTTDAPAPAKPEDKPATSVVPDKYEFTAPEGYEVSSEFLEKATPVLKELGLSQESASRLFDLVQDHMVKAQTDIFNTFDETVAGWRKEIATDKVLGNGRDGFSPETSQNIAAAIGFLPPDLVEPFKQAMNITGAGDNPAFARALSHFGSSVREGKMVSGTKPSPLGQRSPGAAPRSAASAIFPNLPSSSQS